MGKYFRVEDERQAGHRYGPSAAPEQSARHSRALESNSTLFGQLPPWLVLREAIYHLQSSLARHCRAEPCSSWSSWGKPAVWHFCLARPGAALLLMPGTHLPKVNPSQIAELCQSPKGVCCVLSPLSRTSVAVNLNCCSSLLATRCARHQEGKRDHPAFDRAVLGRQKGTHLSALLVLFLGTGEH